MQEPLGLGQVFTDHIPFLFPNQQSQSIEKLSSEKIQNYEYSTYHYTNANSTIKTPQNTKTKTVVMDNSLHQTCV